MGLLLVGNEELRDSLVEIKQLGQRFSAQVTFPPFSRETIAPHLTGFHPHLKDLKSSLDGKQWNKLEKAIFSSANGSIRRLVRLLQKANSLAVRFDSRIDEEVLELAMAGLAKEE